MAYQTGTATSGSDILDKLRIFVLSLGWTVNRWVTAGSGKELCIQKGTSFFNFRSYENESAVIVNVTSINRYGIGLNGSDAYGAGNAWDRQVGYPIRLGGAPTTDQIQAYVPFVVNFGPFPSYYFFSPNTDNVHVEIEVTSGCYLRFGFGKLTLFNSATSGEGRYFYGTNSDATVTSSSTNSSWLGTDIDNVSYSQEEVPFRCADINSLTGQIGSYLRTAFDSFDGWCTSCYTIANNRTGQACQGGGVHDKILRDSSPNSLNGIGFLTSNIVSVTRGTYLNPIGVIPNIRFMDMTNYQPGDEFVIGSDTWKVFPWYQQGGRSYQRGIAYKKIP